MTNIETTEEEKHWTLETSRNHWTLLACRKKAQTKIKTDQNILEKRIKQQFF